jgi:transcriptional regulator with XRE-family HTH domain
MAGRRRPRAREVQLLERFGSNLYSHRKRAGLSQAALAEICGLNRTEISLLERAAREPRVSTIVRLARGLGISPVDLLEGIE